MDILTNVTNDEESTFSERKVDINFQDISVKSVQISFYIFTTLRIFLNIRSSERLYSVVSTMTVQNSKLWRNRKL